MGQTTPKLPLRRQKKFHTAPEKYRNSIAKCYSKKPMDITNSLKFNYLTITGGSFSKDIRNIYKFKDILGEGHFGCVRTAYRRGEIPRKYYAIKSINLQNLSEKDFKNILREVDVISNLHHPNIIKFYETYYDHKYFHIVTELCKGKDVFEKIISMGHISEQSACKIIAKVLRAISYCHSKGITHRDLKPENILFLENESESEIKLIDFGLSKKFISDKKMTTILGTPYYIAPEVLKGSYNYKCDIWSIGAMTFVFLCGDFPYSGSNNDELFKKIVNDEISFSNGKWNGISQEAKDFITICMSKLPDKRPSAQEALSHPWFKHILSEEQSERFLGNDILNNIKKFEHNHKIQILILNFIVNSMNQQEKLKLEKAFNAIDLDHTGHITKNKLENAYDRANITIENEELNGIIENVKKVYGNNDCIEYSHFLMAGLDKEKEITKEKLVQAFEYFDVNQDGFIDENDIKLSLMRAGQVFSSYEEDITNVIHEISKNGKLELNDILKIFNLKF